MDARYDPVAWANFAVATAGAAAALAGLLFVAISLSLKRILEFRRLPGRAAGTLIILVALLISSVFLLAPGQSPSAVGVELLGTGLVLCSAAVLSTRHARSAGDPFQYWLFPFSLAMAPAVLLTVAGLSEWSQRAGGLLWVLAAMIVGLLVAMQNAWVLLVEIHR